MIRPFLPNKATQGLGFFYKAILIFSEFLILSLPFGFSRIKKHNVFILILTLVIFLLSILVIFYIEKTLREDQNPELKKQKNIPTLQFVRIVLLSSAGYIILKNILQIAKKLLLK